jgi:hypothetical protein
MTTTTERWRVVAYGRDCLGNTSGYRVVRGAGWNQETGGVFSGNIYEPGSFDHARESANTLVGELNA